MSQCKCEDDSNILQRVKDKEYLKGIPKGYLTELELTECPLCKRYWLFGTYQGEGWAETVGSEYVCKNKRILVLFRKALLFLKRRLS
jgi:hypothetical protein